MEQLVVSPNGEATEAIEPMQQIRLRPLEIVRFSVPIIGVTPLIAHRWSEKAKREMAEKGGGAKARTQREKRDPEADYQAARYLLAQPRDDGMTDGFPAVAFKAAITSAARAFEGVTMVALKQFIFVDGEPPQMLVPINGTPQIREDTPRVGKGLSTTADLRYRPEYWPWSAVLTIRWPTAMFDVESIVSLVNAAGLGGVGEWRPTSPKSQTGIFGQFSIDFGAEIRKED